MPPIIRAAKTAARSGVFFGMAEYADFFYSAYSHVRYEFVGARLSSLDDNESPRYSYVGLKKRTL